MKRTYRIICFLLITVLFLAGCRKEENPASASNNWEQMINQELLSGTTEIEKAIAASVTISVVEVDAESDQLLVTVSSPEICDSLLFWLENVAEEEFAEEALKSEILQLLNDTEPKEKSFTLSYFIEDEGSQIQYTTEFADAVTCGLTRFYAEITQRVLDSLEVE